MRRNLRLLIATLVTGTALLVVLTQLNTAAILTAVRDVDRGAVALSGLLLLLGSFLAVVRLWFIANDVGHRLSMRDTMLALGFGQLAGAMTIQFFGQIAARTALLSDRGVSAPTNIAIAAYERLVAVAVSVLLAAVGGWNLFGYLALDIKAGGGILLYLIAGLTAAFGTAAYFVWGDTALKSVRAHLDRKIAASLARTAFITLLIQLTTAAAYVVIAIDLAPDKSIGALFAASLVVMFAASLPISFAGWGIRELSAAVALTAIGMQSASAVAVAAIVGLLALAAIIIVAAAAALMPPSSSHVEQTSSATTNVNVEALIKWTLPILAATAVFFQVHVPTMTQAIAVNLADPIVVLGGALFFIYRVVTRRTQWRVRWVDLFVVLATAVMIFALANGYFFYGSNDWALTNKGLGWFVLLAYGATGALMVNRFGKPGLLWIVQTFAFSAAAICMLGAIMTMITAIRGPFPQEIFVLPFSGFTQNRNAFALLLLFAVAAVPLQPERYRPWLLGILSFGVILTGSRSGVGSLAVILTIALFARLIRISDFIKATVTVAAIFVLLESPPYLARAANVIRDLVSEPGAGGGGGYAMPGFSLATTTNESDHERMRS